MTQSKLLLVDSFNIYKDILYVSFVLLTVVSCSIGRQAAVNGAMASQHQRAEKKEWTCPFWPVSLCYIDRNVATLLNMTFSNI